MAPQVLSEVLEADDSFMNIASLAVYEDEEKAVEEGYAPMEEWTYWVVL